MAQWIKVTPRLEAGLKIVDQLDNGKFSALVNHLCATLQLGIDRDIFNEKEKEKLIASLEINKETLSILLDTIKLIYLQAAYSIVKPNAMEVLMKQSFSISEEKIMIFVNTWITYGKGIVEAFMQKSDFPVQVEDISWDLSIRSSSSAMSYEAQPVVRLQLGLTGPKEKSNLTVEMDNNQLTDIYNKFEQIQRQLDLLDSNAEKNSA